MPPRERASLAPMPASGTSFGVRGSALQATLMAGVSILIRSTWAFSTQPKPYAALRARGGAADPDALEVERGEALVVDVVGHGDDDGCLFLFFVDVFGGVPLLSFDERKKMRSAGKRVSVAARAASSRENVTRKLLTRGDGAKTSKCVQAFVAGLPRQVEQSLRRQERAYFHNASHSPATHRFLPHTFSH